jgi:hypothetical protein
MVFLLPVAIVARCVGLRIRSLPDLGRLCDGTNGRSPSAASVALDVR